MNKLHCHLVSAIITGIYVVVVLTLSDYKDQDTTTFFIILISSLVIFEVSEFFLKRKYDL